MTESLPSTKSDELSPDELSPDEKARVLVWGPAAADEEVAAEYAAYAAAEEEATALMGGWHPPCGLLTEAEANLQHISKLCCDGEAYRAERQSRAPPSPPRPDGLRTSAEAARKPRPPTLRSVAKQASKAEIEVARYEVRPDGTVVVVTGEPEPAAPENPWSLDEFRTKETKQ